MYYENKIWIGDADGRRVCILSDRHGQDDYA